MLSNSVCFIHPAWEHFSGFQRHSKGCCDLLNDVTLLTPAEIRQDIIRRPAAKMRWNVIGQHKLSAEFKLDSIMDNGSGFAQKRDHVMAGSL
eukprot:1154345-Pelagomonas_calceolata.AAC.4